VSIKEIRCPHCGAQCRPIDKTKDEYHCDHCDSTFRLIDSTKKMVVRDTRPHNCPICGRPVKVDEGYLCLDCGTEYVCSSCIQNVSGRSICKNCLEQKGMVIGSSKVCPKCKGPLNYIRQYNRWYCFNCRIYPAYICPTCGGTATYVAQYDKWYCHNCKAYTTKREIASPTTQVAQAQAGIVNEPQYICDVCGRKKPVSQMAGKCVTCGKYVCTPCSVFSNGRIYCAKHAPKSQCFIATAAYGTPMCTEIYILRQFRDEKLNPNPMGEKLVELYCDISPPLADMIRHHDWLRALTRKCLEPFIYIARNSATNERKREPKQLRHDS